MDRKEMEAFLKKVRLVPVVKLDRAEDAAFLGEALCEGGLPVAEVTFRTDAAEESIRILREKFPDMQVGAGTVVNVEQFKHAVEAGASFIVCPGLHTGVIEAALDIGIPILPGACTPSEIISVMDYGLSIVKFFPAQQYGGLDTIKALSGPFPSMKFMPTGGVGLDNILEYLAFKKVIACGGSWMVKDTLIQEGEFEEITRRTRDAVALLKGVS